MTLLKEIINALEGVAPLSLQESYDNSGLQVGDPQMPVKGILVSLDVTEEVLQEAERLGFNLVVSHHPVLFKGLRSITGKSSTERIIQTAIRKDIAIYSGHTNFDSVAGGVNTYMADRLGLQEQQILQAEGGALKKLVVFIPRDHLEPVRQAIFDAGAGHIGAYDSCSFRLEGTGSFRGSEDSQPFTGEAGKFSEEEEVRLETIVPAPLVGKVVNAMMGKHPYEEVAYDIYPLENTDPRVGMGMIGKLPEAMDEESFLSLVKERFQCAVIRHTALRGKAVKKVALCGGAGSFLLSRAKAKGADVFISGDVKYHQFFDAEGKIVLMDIGHFESEQFTRELFYDLLMKKFPKFAIRLSETQTNPIKYY
jgi:dinuclear metal center YbgI/SA1388 family protein